MIRVREFTKNFGAIFAVQGISFEVAKGEIFAFLGPNGAGKTTTIKMLTTLLKPSSGSVELDGLNPATQQQETRNQLWSHVKRLNEMENVTVFLTTHYMEEAERVAHRIAIMDHGRIIAHGSAAEVKQQTGADSLENAFLALTGTSIREEEGGSIVRMRRIAKLLRR